MHRGQKRNFAIRAGTVKARVSQEFNFSAMKLFDRFRKSLMRFIFSIPSKGSQTMSVSGSAPRRRSCDRPDPPKTSCSSYYSPNSHYSEAIADCIEFLNKSQQGINFTGVNSDSMV